MEKEQDVEGENVRAAAAASLETALLTWLAKGAEAFQGEGAPTRGGP